MEEDTSSYVRVAGFLYIRYLSPPDQLFQRLGNYLLDAKRFRHSYDRDVDQTIGEFVANLLGEKSYFGSSG